MVRGRPQIKTVSAKKNIPVSTTRQSSSVASPQVAAANPRKSQGASTTPLCSDCGTAITDDTKALQCDKCQTEKWKCISCLSISAEMYDQLLNDTSCGLRWFCDACDRAVMAVDGKSGGCGSACTGNCDKIDKLVSLVETLVGKLVDVEEKLNEKCAVKVVDQMESRIQKIEDRLTRNEGYLEQRLAETDKHVCKVVNDKIQMLDDKKEFHDPATAVEQAVKDEIEKQLIEDKDIEARRCNIIMYRIPENLTEDLSTRKANDTKFVADLLAAVFQVNIQDGDIVKQFRLGRFSTAAEGARPLLVGFKDIETKDEIMSNVRKLRQADPQFTSVSIANDLTPKQREEVKNMITAAKREHAENNSESLENFRFLVVGQGPRKKVIKLKK